MDKKGSIVSSIHQENVLLGGGDVGNFLQHVTVTGVQLLYEALPDLQESYKSLPVSFLSLFSPLHSLSCEDAL